jgi:hypothetical protein
VKSCHVFCLMTTGSRVCGRPKVMFLNTKTFALTVFVFL